MKLLQIRTIFLDTLNIKITNVEDIQIAWPITSWHTNLYLTYSKKRRVFGKLLKREMSPFIDDIEALLKNHESPGLKARLENELKKGKKATQIQLELF